MKLTHFVRTPLIITAHFADGSTTTFATRLFEEWVDKYDHRLVTFPNADSEYDQEDARLLSWEEYWSEPFVLGDVATYIEHCNKRDALIDAVAETLATC